MPTKPARILTWLAIESEDAYTPKIKKDAKEYWQRVGLLFLFIENPVY